MNRGGLPEPGSPPSSAIPISRENGTMTPVPSSQSVDPAQPALGSWTARARALQRRDTMKLIAGSSHYQAMLPSARRLVRVLVAFHNPETGLLGIRTKNEILMDRMQCSESTLKRARHEVIEAGWIVGYRPGNGIPQSPMHRWAGTYTIARTLEEAAAARALRIARRKAIEAGIPETEIEIPKWPVAPEREPLAPPATERKPRAETPAKRPSRPRVKPAAHPVETPTPQRIETALPEGRGSRWDGPVTPERRAENTRGADLARAARAAWEAAQEAS